MTVILTWRHPSQCNSHMRMKWASGSNKAVATAGRSLPICCAILFLSTCGSTSTHLKAETGLGGGEGGWCNRLAPYTWRRGRLRLCAMEDMSSVGFQDGPDSWVSSEPCGQGAGGDLVASSRWEAWRRTQDLRSQLADHTPLCTPQRCVFVSAFPSKSACDRPPGGGYVQDAPAMHDG